MKTNFFKIINHLKSPGSWTIHISPLAEGKMIVSVLLSDPACEKEGVVLSPMIFNESPESLDDEFFSRLMEPVTQINEIFVNAGELQKSLDAAKKQLAAKAQTGKTDPARPKADDAAGKKQKYEDALKKIAELNAACKYREAIELIPDPADYPEKKEELEKLRTELEAKNKQLSLL